MIFELRLVTADRPELCHRQPAAPPRVRGPAVLFETLFDSKRLTRRAALLPFYGEEYSMIFQEISEEGDPQKVEELEVEGRKGEPAAWQRALAFDS